MNKQEVMDEWMKVSKYPGDHEKKIGCCGGDYCDDPYKQDHNKIIADWWIEKINLALQEQQEEIIKKIEEFILKNTIGYPFPTKEEAVVRKVIEIIKNTNAE